MIKIYTIYAIKFKLLKYNFTIYIYNTKLIEIYLILYILNMGIGD